MTFGSYEPSPKTTIPTFFQYVKTVGKGVEGKTKFAVDLVWIPGKFDNVTLQTHAFRYVCDPNHALYRDVLDFFANAVFEDEHPQMAIVISSIAKKTITIELNPKRLGVWENIGTMGYKFKQNE